MIRSIANKSKIIKTRSNVQKDFGMKIKSRNYGNVYFNELIYLETLVLI